MKIYYKNIIFFFLKPFVYKFSIIILFSSHAAIAQNSLLALSGIQNFKRTEYAGGAQNWDIAQSNKTDYLYFANNNGLLEYDGVSWNIMHIPNSESVRAVAIDKSDNIFVGGYKEFGYFNKNNSGVYVYNSLSDHLRIDDKETDFIWKIHIINNTVIYQSFSKLYVYKNKKLTIHKATSKFQFSFVVANNLYVQDQQVGIIKFENNAFQKLITSEIFNNTEIWGMLELPNKNFLIATLDNGLWVFDGIKTTKWFSDIYKVVKQSSCLGMTMLANKNIAYNTVLDGLIIANENGKIINKICRKNSLQNNTVLHSFIDKKQNIWLGLDNGISFVNNENPFSLFGTDYNLTTVYGSIKFQDKLYVATNQGLFFKYLKNLATDESFQLVAGTTGQVWSVNIIDDQLFCGHNRGAMLIKNNTVRSILQPTGTWNFKNSKDDANHAISSNYNGFALFKKINGNWQKGAQIAGHSGSVNNFEFSDKSLWFIKNNVIQRLYLTADYDNIAKKENYRIATNSKAALSEVLSINNEIIIICDNVFYYYDKSSNSFRRQKILSKMFQNVGNVSSCQADSFGNIWYISNESISVKRKINERKYETIDKKFHKLKGNLVANYTNINALSDSNFLIGTNDGLVYFNIDNVAKSTDKPKVFIKNVLFGNHRIVNSYENFKIKKTISYNDNNLTFMFSAPNYESISNTTFSFKLVGFDSEWSSWTKSTFKEYTNLREGNYTMIVRTNQGSGNISRSSSCQFKISPPWYRNALALLIYFITICFAVYYLQIFVKRKIRQNKYYETIEQRRIYSEKEFKIRQEQLELEKEIERLKSAKLQSEILLKDKELVNNSLQSVKKNKILNGILEGLKEIETDKLEESTKLKFAKLNKNISKEVNQDKSWKNLEHHIKNVHYDFIRRLKEKYPNVSPREMDLATYLLLNMSTKEIAEALNISSAGVELARYRLRKKLNLVNKENLTGFLMTI